MAEEPIVRITDQSHLRAKILEQRDGGDPRWQQKWDDLDAFPYNDTVQHQQEWMVDHPVFAGFLQSVSKPAPKAAAPAPAPLPPVQKYTSKVAVPPRQQVDPRAEAAQSPLNKWMPPAAAKSFGGGPPVPQPAMRPTMQGPGQAQGQYTPPPATRPHDMKSYLSQYGLDQWMPPETADLFRKR